MPIGITIKVALKSLYANKLRSILAMLGIIIGVGAVISMLAIGAGAQAQVMERISSMGTRLLVVRPGQHGTHGVMSGQAQNLTEEDALAILNQLDSIVEATPVVSGNAQIKYFANNSRSNVIGTAITYFSIRNYEVEYGRAFTEAEVQNRARVAVMGPTTAEQLGFNINNIGESVKIDGLNFTVVGILKTKGDQGWYNPDDRLLVPFTTAMNTIFGQDSVDEIDLMAAENVDLTVVEEEVADLLRERHRIGTGGEDDFYVRNQADIIETADEFNRTFTILLGAIASISLLVGGIGIMNIMLVTVTERTREIGIRKAIGAKDRDILSQFLLEAVIMSVFSGIIGIGAGLGGADLINATTEFATLVQPFAIIVAFSFAVTIGIFFGYYPASRAAMLDPIDSLYYE
ncbi:MAG TPA: ABC transporter permease [bacterium]|jgi:putative ABC transport system permease protein